MKIAWMMILPVALAAQSATSLQLIETKVEARTDSGWQVANGSASQTLPSGKTQYKWSPPPGSIDASGFTMSMSVQAQGTGGRMAGFVAIARTSGFTFEPGGSSAATPEALAEPGKSDAKSSQVRIRPATNLSDGQIVELHVGAAFGPGVLYRFKASRSGGMTGGGNTGTGAGSDPSRRLSARLDCPGSITISALPSLNCHILISGWRRNTADPVEVIFPDALDTFGNHTNGIQLLGRGSEDIFNWDDPQHSWGIFVFACPGQQGTGANCYSHVTVPGTAAVRIIVRQKGAEVRLVLTLNAIARPGGTTGSGGGKTGGGVTTSVTTEVGTNRPGGDIRNFELTQADPAMCRQACSADSRCQSYSYVKPGLQGKNAHCWIKDRVPPAERSDCCVSGVKVNGIR